MSIVKKSIEKSEIKYKKEFIYCILIILQILLGIQFNILMYSAFVMTAILILISKNNSYMLYLVFLLPYSYIFKMSITGGISGINILIMVTVIKQILDFYVNKYSIKIIHIFLLLILSMYIFFTSQGEILGVIQIIANFLFIVLYSNSISTTKNRENFKSLIIFYVVGLLIASLIALLKDFYPALNQLLIVEQTRLADGTSVNRFAGLTTSTNYYSLDIMIAFSLIILLYYKKEIKKTFLIFSPLLIAFGFMTLSKSFIVGFIIIIFYTIIIIFLKDLLLGIKTFFWLLITLLAAYFVISKEVLMSLMKRLSEDFSDLSNLDAISTNRSTIYSKYWDYIWQDANQFFLGSGINADLLGGGSHNAYLEIWFHLGLIGMLIYLSLVLSIIFSSRKNYIINYISILPLLVLILRASAINLMFRDNIYFYIIFIAIAIRYTPKLNKERLIRKSNKNTNLIN